MDKMRLELSILRKDVRWYFPRTHRHQRQPVVGQLQVRTKAAAAHTIGTWKNETN